MRPLIGITTELAPDRTEGRDWYSSTLIRGYAEGVEAAGGACVMLPLAREGVARGILERLDGLILSGGLDIPAGAFGEAPHPKLEPMHAERWPSEKLWLETAFALGMPVLGVCLGMQVMGVAAGAKLIQDLPSERPDSIVHTNGKGMLRHEVEIVEGTRLAGLAPGRTVTITSSHHQAIREVPEGYRLAALGPDGVIEAMERPGGPFVMGVQWHPERGPAEPDWVLAGFVGECVGRAGCRRV